MRSRNLRCAVAIGVAVCCAAGCSDNDSHYGPPDGLTGKVIPQPTFGTTPVGSQDAGPAVDAGPCAISWSSQIFPNMVASGEWKCAQSSCHGGLQAPRMSNDASATYASLVAYTMVPPAPAIPYVLPGETDPSKSGIECNLSGGTCSTQMPLTQNGATHLTSDEVTTLDTWVKCGAPNN